jgi:hypothetical protein
MNPIKIQVKSIHGDILFEYEKENNTLRDTIIEAVKKRADLRSANLSGANLRSAYLSGADLSGADLSGADLRSADLRSANLSGAYLSGAYLSGAYLRSANLSGADLRSADLSGADLRSADLTDAKDAEYAIALTRILPEGDIIGYKKAYDEATHSRVVIKLRIPTEAKRSSAFGRKCRAEYADVIEIIGHNSVKAYSDHNHNFKYEVGQRVKPEKAFDENWMEECASGIHFFITKLEAEKY